MPEQGKRLFFEITTPDFLKEHWAKHPFLNSPVFQWAETCSRMHFVSGDEIALDSHAHSLLQSGDETVLTPSRL